MIAPSPDMRVEADGDVYLVSCLGIDPTGAPIARIVGGFNEDGRSVARCVADAIDAHVSATMKEQQ